MKIILDINENQINLLECLLNENEIEQENYIEALKRENKEVTQGLRDNFEEIKDLKEKFLDQVQ